MVPLNIGVETAGGVFTTLGGEATVHGGSGVSSNGYVQDLILQSLTSN